MKTSAITAVIAWGALALAAPAPTPVRCKRPKILQNLSPQDS